MAKLKEIDNKIFTLPALFLVNMKEVQKPESRVGWTLRSCVSEFLRGLYYLIFFTVNLM